MRAVIELEALRGVAQVTAVTIVAELGQISRFAKATPLMGYAGNRKLLAQGKNQPQMVTAVERELLGLSGPAE